MCTVTALAGQTQRAGITAEDRFTDYCSEWKGEVLSLKLYGLN